MYLEERLGGIMNEYLERIIETLRAIDVEEGEAISRAADVVADVIVRDGIVYVFGCGHSHLPALDAFYRAGGLANVSPILDVDLMLNDGAAKSSRMEKMPGLAAEVFRRYRVTPNDMLVVISASGKNAVPVEMAKAGRAAGVTTVAITSSAYRPHGATLADVADIAIDSKVPYGDACIEVGEAKMGGLSTAASCFILNSFLIEGARRALARGVTPPIYASGNIEGGTARNVVLEERFMGRVKNL